MTTRTPTFDPGLPRRYADFATLDEALDYAAQGQRGVNFFSARGELADSVTYTELRERAIGIAKRLMGMNIEAGARVALIADTSANFLASFLGCQYAGLLPVPLPLPTSFGGREGYTEQLRLQIESCDASVAISPNGMTDLLREATDDLGLRFVGADVDLLALPERDMELRRPRSQDLAYLQYSSGSTRFPHGVAITHEALMTNCNGQGFHGVQLLESDRCVSWLPFYHDMGLVGCFLTALSCQVSCDFLSTESFARRPMQWLHLITANEGTTISYSPTFGYDICARRAKPEIVAELDLSRWRVAGNGGDMIRPDVMQKFVDMFAPAGFQSHAFMPSYGLAECTLAVSFMPAGHGIVCDMVDEAVLSGETHYHRGRGLNGHGSLNGHSHVHGSNGHGGNGIGHGLPGINGHGRPTRYRSVVNCGVPLPDYEIEIRDEQGLSLGERGIGRIVVRGKSVMVGYFNDEHATRQVLDAEGWLDTGDMGYMLDGCLYVVGRAKDMIIINGKNHWPQDIEWAVEQLPGLRNGDIAVIATTDEHGEEGVTVLVQCRIGDHGEREALKTEIKKKVKQVTGIPCQVELVPPRTLPRTSSGKLSRAKARDRYLSGGLVPLAVAS